MLYLQTKHLQEPVTLRHLPTLRQAFVVASLIIFIAFGLGELVHPDWVYLALLPAFGLLFSGLTGMCPMILILQALPWNRDVGVDQEITEKE